MEDEELKKIIKKVRKIRLKKMKKKNPRRFDLREFIDENEEKKEEN